MRRDDATILTYYGYRAVTSVGFIWPVFTLFLLWNDLSFAEIGVLSSISAVLVVALEIPTGYVADRLGRRTALAAGIVAMTVSITGFVVADAFWHFAILYGLWSLSIAFQSGTADAWLYDALSEEQRADEFVRVRGRGGAVQQWTSAVTMILGGALYTVHPTYPFLASAVLNGIGVGIVRSMPRNERFRAEAASDRPDVLESLSVIRREFTRPSLRSFVAYAALYFGIIRAADEYVQPIAVDALEPLVRIGPVVAEEAMLGALYATFAVVAAIASDAADGVRSTLGLRTALLWLPVVVATILLVPVAVPLLAIPVFVAMKGATALSQPLVNQYLNDRTGSGSRATVLSAASMAYASVRAPLMPVAGAFADLTSPLSTVAGLGAFFLFAALVLTRFSTPVARATSAASVSE